MRVKCAVRGCKSRFIKKRWNHKYCVSCATQEHYARVTEWEQRRRKKDPDGTRRYHRKNMRKLRAKIKVEVLSHYGKKGRLICSWHKCEISDVDMLSIDHIKNDGKTEKGGFHRQGGYGWYQRLRRLGFPKGFQTLCFNHQLKKEILRRRKIRIK